MHFNKLIDLNGLQLFVEETTDINSYFIIATQSQKYYHESFETYKIENESDSVIVLGQQWRLKSDIIPTALWIFKRSFEGQDDNFNFTKFIEILDLLQSEEIKIRQFYLLGEILFAYKMNLDKSQVIDWLSKKNRSFDFSIKDIFYEIKTTYVMDSNVIINLSYNQLSSLHNDSLELIIIDLNSDHYTIEIEELQLYFESMELDHEFLTIITDCLNMFDDRNKINFGVLNYIGPKILIELDSRIIQLDCKLKLDVKKDLQIFNRR